MPKEEMVKQAAELVAAGERLLQIRTEKQLLVAMQRPRDEGRFGRKLKAEAALAGDDFFYSIPYKDHVQGCQDRRGCKCPTTWVEGPGVGLMRSGARLWGNCAVEVALEADYPDAWVLGGWFLDFESNYALHEVARVSKIKVLKGGRTVVARDQDAEQLYQIGAAKLARNLIKHALPHHVIQAAFELAKTAALQEKKPIPEQIARLVRRYKEAGVGLGQLEQYLGAAFTEQALRKAGRDPREVCAELRGLLTAISGGDVSVEEVFGAVEPPASASRPEDITAEDIAGATAAAPEAAPPRQSAGRIELMKAMVAARIAVSGENIMALVRQGITPERRAQIASLADITEEEYRAASDLVERGGQP